MKLSKEQNKIVTAEEDKIIVLAAAASGKTRTAIERIKYLIDKGVNPEKMVIITFTNMAAEVLLERLGNVNGIFVGTIHSYGNYLLRTIGVDTSELIEREDFDGIFPLVKKHPECIKEVDYLIMDESHDSSENQFSFVLDMIKPKAFMFFGDLRQTIYSWRDAKPEILVDLMNMSDVTTYKLKENYRNSTKILDFAKRMINPLGYEYYDDSIPMRFQEGTVINIEYDEYKIMNLIKKDGQYKDWFVLTRSNSQLEYLGSLFEKNGIPYNTFKQGNLSLEELKEQLEEDKVVLLTSHSSKGLERKKVVVIGNTTWSEEERRLSYVSATRAMDLLVWCTPKKKKKTYTYDWE